MFTARSLRSLETPAYAKAPRAAARDKMAGQAEDTRKNIWTRVSRSETHGLHGNFKSVVFRVH
jgi:hypothetical protein